MAELLSASAIDLGGGHQGLVIRGHGECLCSPEGNCDVWVFESGGGAPALLLRASEVQEVTAQEPASNGYRGLLTSMRVSASVSDLFLYQFDGKEYRLKQCMRRAWTDARGRRLSRARLTPSSCEPQGKAVK